jgi:hypothetical protein
MFHTKSVRPRAPESLAPLLHHKPSALLSVELEHLHGGSLGGGLIVGDHVPEISGARVPKELAALSDQRDAPATHGRILLGRHPGTQTRRHVGYIATATGESRVVRGLKNWPGLTNARAAS